MTFRLLHIADLHLDMSFAADGLPAGYGAWRRTDLRATLGRILTLARERAVDVVTIAGDLYDDQFAVPDTASFLAQQFSQIDPIHIVIAPGQSDPYTTDSLYALTRWPRNVTVFSQGRLEPSELAPSVYVWGAACPPPRGVGTLAATPSLPDSINFLLLHAMDAGQVGTVEGQFVVQAEAVRQAGFDCALLGGEHLGRRWLENGPVCVYPGSPEPLGWSETQGLHSVVLVTLEDQRLAIEAIETNQWRYSAVTVDLTATTSMAEAHAAVGQALAAHNVDHERTVVRVTLTGDPDYVLTLEPLKQGELGAAYLLVEPRLTLAYDLSQLAQEPTVRGRLVQRVQQELAKARTEQERQTLRDALRLALRTLDGKEVRPYEVH